MLDKIGILDKTQFCPTFEDIENQKVKELTKRLKGVSDKETLTNILEWQEKNILPWSERFYMFIPLYFLLIISLWLLPIPEFIKLIVISLFILFALVNIITTLSYILPLISCVIALFILLYSINFSFAETLFPLSNLIALSIIFGGILFLLIYLILKYRNIKLSRPEFKLEDTFKLSLEIDKILNYKLAICRDYAKLTACLLYNLFPRNEIYFLNFPGHVAAGIKINNKIYVLDQKLPVLTLEKWMLKWKKNKVNAYRMKVKNSGVDLEKTEVTLSPSESYCSFKELEENVKSILKISRSDKEEGKCSKTIVLKNYALYYEDDEIVKHSVIRAIKNKLENEFCGNVDKIVDIRIEQSENKKDLIVKVLYEVK